MYSVDVPLVEFMYLVFTRMPGENYRRRLRSLLYLYYVFRALRVAMVVGVVVLVLRISNASSGYGGVGRAGEVIYLSLHCHHKNHSCIKTGSDERSLQCFSNCEGQSHN